MKTIPLLLACLILIACQQQVETTEIAESATTPIETQPIESTDSIGPVVTTILDGDSFVIDTGERVRLICVDANSTKTPDGLAAKELLEKLLIGKHVRLEREQSETDAYGRLVRHAYVDNISVSEALLKEGLAKVYPFGPDVAYCEEFAAIEREARMTKRGLWNKTMQAQ